MGKIKINEIQVQEIISKYATDTYNYNKLAQEYSVSPSTIKRILTNNNIPQSSHFHRKYWLDENYFSKIDNEEKAYFLGLLYADGCNYTKNNTVSLSLNETDKALIEKLRTAIAPTKPIYIYKPKKKNCKNQYTICLTSKKLSENLTALGCVSNKSSSLKFPNSNQVPPELLNHFVRGYFDGDGHVATWISKTGHSRFEISIVSSISFCDTLAEFIRNDLKIKCNIRIPKNTNQVVYVVITGRKNVQRFAKWIYRNANIYMSRKRDYFDSKIINKKPNLKSSQRGVFFHPRDKKWVAQVYFKSKTYYLGYFSSKELAASAVLEKDKELGIIRECDLD